jgi:hypothetical protein
MPAGTDFGSEPSESVITHTIHVKQSGHEMKEELREQIATLTPKLG